MENSFLQTTVIIRYYLQARKFAGAMKAPLIFCSAVNSINVQQILKVLLSKVFDLECTVPEISGMGEPILEYRSKQRMFSRKIKLISFFSLIVTI